MKFWLRVTSTDATRRLHSPDVDATLWYNVYTAGPGRVVAVVLEKRLTGVMKR